MYKNWNGEPLPITSLKNIVNGKIIDDPWFWPFELYLEWEEYSKECGNEVVLLAVRC